MNYDSLSISVTKLAEDVKTVKDSLDSYIATLESFKTNVTSVQKGWTGDESGVMAAFKTKYEAAETTLDELQTLLTNLHSVMSTKCEEFRAAESAALSLFQ